MGLFTLIRAYKSLNALNEANNKRTGKLKHLNEVAREHQEQLSIKDDTNDMLRTEIKVMKNKLNEYESWYQAGREQIREPTPSVGDGDVGQFFAKGIGGLVEGAVPGIGAKRLIDGIYSKPEFKMQFDGLVDAVMNRGAQVAMEALGKSGDPIADIAKYNGMNKAEVIQK